MESLFFHFQVFSKILAVGAGLLGLLFIFVAVVSFVDESINLQRVGFIILVLSAIYGGFLWVEGFLK